MSSAQLEQFSPARLPATLRAVKTLSLVAAIVAVALLVFVVGIESVLPVDAGAAVRDGVGLGITAVASWALFAVAVWMRRAFPRPTAAFAAILAVMIGLGGIAFIANFGLDLALRPGVIALAVPAALIVCVVVPGVYLAFTARAIARHAGAR
jgi:hypothetical protein